LRGLIGLAERVVAREVANLEVVDVDMEAGRDRLRGESDDLAVAPHRLARGDPPRGDLVPRRNALLAHDTFLQEVGAGFELAAGDDDVVGGIETQVERGFAKHGKPQEGRAYFIIPGSHRLIEGM